MESGTEFLRNKNLGKSKVHGLGMNMYKCDVV
jgi:hypothetical protein